MGSQGKKKRCPIWSDNTLWPSTLWSVWIGCQSRRCLTLNQAFGRGGKRTTRMERHREWKEKNGNEERRWLAASGGAQRGWKSKRLGRVSGENTSDQLWGGGGSVGRGTGQDGHPGERGRRSWQTGDKTMGRWLKMEPGRRLHRRWRDKKKKKTLKNWRWERRTASNLVWRREWGRGDAGRKAQLVRKKMELALEGV